MRPLVQPWTVEDDERLRMFVAQGASLVHAAAAFRRRKESPRLEDERSRYTPRRCNFTAQRGMIVFHLFRPLA
jgi:hypothetical protein